MSNGKKIGRTMALKMLDTKWATDGQEHIVAFFKRGDQARYGFRNGQCVGYILPSQWDANQRFLPEVSEFNSEAFTVVYLPKTALDSVRAAIAQNADLMNSGSADRVVVDDAILPVAVREKINTPDLIAPVDCTKASTALKSVTLETAEEQFVRDFKAIAQGSATYGSGGTYALQSAAYADLANLTGALTFTRVSATTETAQSSISVNLAGQVFTDNGACLLATLSIAGPNWSHSAGTAGTVNLYGQCWVRDSTALPAGTAMALLTATAAHTRNIYNCRMDGNSVANSRGIQEASANPLNIIWNVVIKKCASIGLYLAASNLSSKFENMVLDTNANAIGNSSLALSYRNVFFINNTNNWFLPTNSTAVNCATDKVAVGAATDTNPQVSATVADELISTTMTDTVNGYRLKSDTSTKLKSNGAAPEIAGNTTDIFGKPRPDYLGGYSIGISELTKANTAGALGLGLHLTGLMMTQGR